MDGSWIYIQWFHLLPAYCASSEIGCSEWTVVDGFSYCLLIWDIRIVRRVCGDLTLWIRGNPQLAGSLTAVLPWSPVSLADHLRILAAVGADDIFDTPRHSVFVEEPMIAHSSPVANPARPSSLVLEAAEHTEDGPPPPPRKESLAAKSPEVRKLVGVIFSWRPWFFLWNLHCMMKLPG